MLMNIHELVIKRNNFYQNLMRYQFILIIILSIGIYGNVLFIKEIVKNYSKPKYIMTDKLGDLLEDKPKSLPIYTNEDVSQWAQEKIVEILSLNFLKYENQLNQIGKYFNEMGYVKYLDALKKSRNISALTHNKYVTIVDVLTPFRVDSTRYLGLNGEKIFSWVVKGQISAKYLNTKNAADPFIQDLNITMLLVRESFFLYENGISIYLIIAE